MEPVAWEIRNEIWILLNQSPKSNSKPISKNSGESFLPFKRPDFDRITLLEFDFKEMPMCVVLVQPYKCIGCPFDYHHDYYYYFYDPFVIGPVWNGKSRCVWIVFVFFADFNNFVGTIDKKQKQRREMGQLMKYCNLIIAQFLTLKYMRPWFFDKNLIRGWTSK